MKIIFLGTSHGVPEPNRKCSCTMIEVGENRYFIDMGTPAGEQLVTRGIPFGSVKSIFITHMHGDHTNGLIPFLDLCSWKFKSARPSVYIPGNVENVRDAMAHWVKVNGVTLGDFNFCPINEGVFYDDGVLRITAFRTKHIEYSYAYLAEAEGKRVLFSGDLSHKGPEDDFPVSVLDSPLDLAICECAHFDASKYLPIFEGRDNLKKLCFNHYSSRFLESVAAMGRLLPNIPVLRATDDLEITL